MDLIISCQFLIMDWLKGQVDIENKLRLNAVTRAAGGGFEIGLKFSNLTSKRANVSFPQYELLSIPSVTVMHSSENKAGSIDYLITSEVPFNGFFGEKEVAISGSVELKPEESSQYLSYFCIVKPDQWRRMREIVQKVGLLELKLLISFPLLEKTGALWSYKTFWALVILIHISKANLEECVSVWTKARDSIRDLPKALPEKVLLDILEASKCMDIEVSKAAVVMARRALQNALLIRGADKTLPLHKQIGALKDSGVISNDVASLAHGVRYLGNFGAHPDDDLLNDVNFEDAKLAYQVVLKILTQLFPS